MTPEIVWMLASSLVAGVGIFAITFGVIHADEARSRKKKSTDG